MATLYKRITKEQRAAYRAICGAVINAQDAHGLPHDKLFARSVAKRALGTLLATGALDSQIHYRIVGAVHEDGV